ncbi:MAG: lamin tail domain-containing protein [Krumholzibacteria bacterium]|nr:lamin tail domain-containing protein [Candidatus Krumholzibacteria bacterium]
MKTLLTCLLVLAVAGAAQAQTGVYFSEYLEGSSNNKAVEIYNGTNETLDMSTIVVERYNNGSLTPTATYAAFVGLVLPGDVFVVGNPSTGVNATIVAESDLLSDLTFYNGDDCLLLYQNGVLVDSIGQVGFDPGTNWSVGGCATSEMTLVRKADSCFGDTDPSDVYDPSVDWDCYPQDTVSYLGSHSTLCDVVVPADDTSWGAIKSLFR